jgi:uncharacterized protein YabN with tetrapyrrole methylase and pyrophosphatase domain
MDDQPSRVDELAAAMREVLDHCVWSQGMTHATLAPYLIEECYELLEALETGARQDLIEELGDVLLQVVFHCEIARRSRDEAFDIQDVAAAVTEKIIRRHPHVFAGEQAETPEDVLRLWTDAKAKEKATRASVLEGVPQGMPALSLASKLIERARQVGVTVAPSVTVASSTEEGLGSLLLGVVASAQANGLDPEGALRASLRHLRREILEAESRTATLRDHGLGEPET